MNHATASGKSWPNGGSPTSGFLKSVDVGPFQSPFHSIAGSWWANWLFMLGMLGVGVAIIAGVAMRAAAVAGVAILARCGWPSSRWPDNTSAGAPTGSSNPIVDYHFLHAAVLVVLALTCAGSIWGLGRVWNRLPFVQRHHWAAPRHTPTDRFCYRCAGAALPPVERRDWCGSVLLSIRVAAPPPW